jgi:hypothetical protein
MIQQQTILVNENGVGYKVSAVKLGTEVLAFDFLIGNEGSGEYEVMVFAHDNGVTDYRGIRKYQFDTVSEVLARYDALVEEYKAEGYEVTK